MGVLVTKNFDLDLTLESGQFFRYYKEKNHYTLITQGKTIIIGQNGDVLTFTGADEAFVAHFLSLNEQYPEELANDPIISPLIEKYSGLRIMKQNLHETILGFICSSNNNIKRIKMNLHLIAENLGTEMHLPEPGKKLSEKILKEAKTGYRAKYLSRANAMLTKKFLETVKNSSYKTSHELLCTLPGVGPKVADCICLYSLGHKEAFPVDVHIHRAMKKLFPRSKLTTPQKAKTYAQKKWTNAGLAQQFIFEWARNDFE